MFSGSPEGIAECFWKYVHSVNTQGHLGTQSVMVDRAVTVK